MPEPAPGASIVQPATIEEQTATALFLSYVDELRDVVAQLVQRVELGREHCRGRVVGNPPP